MSVSGSDEYNISRWMYGKEDACTDECIANGATGPGCQDCHTVQSPFLILHYFIYVFQWDANPRGNLNPVNRTAMNPGGLVQMGCADPCRKHFDIIQYLQCSYNVLLFIVMFCIHFICSSEGIP